MAAGRSMRCAAALTRHRHHRGHNQDGNQPGRQAAAPAAARQGVGHAHAGRALPAVLQTGGKRGWRHGALASRGSSVLTRAVGTQMCTAVQEMEWAQRWQRLQRLRMQLPPTSVYPLPHSQRYEPGVLTQIWSQPAGAGVRRALSGGAVPAHRQQRTQGVKGRSSSRGANAAAGPPSMSSMHSSMSVHWRPSPSQPAQADGGTVSLVGSSRLRCERQHKAA